MDNMSKQASRIKERRRQLGFSQEELASRVGISQGQISSYERGEHEPTASILMALARELEVSSDYLLGLHDDPTPSDTSPDLSETERKIITLIRRDHKIEAIRLIIAG